ncbi:hypothetical protein ALI144C_03705 [Actinosynnema sp. ALI-1.44]|uniref:nSTAND1 domain-containing NTPase n=1 Tax=Actinosynnema sp. ALI-1.44 TaxID=1933779 RepID=UPI00097C4269|nr:helix-turn-helix domain-containing protein [Actinosynnema sp. ALI-1.44]ONI90134.1 hypothetical protein ALI144C_03705 [Actinosynnema sp. ALI-1.44]
MVRRERPLDTENAVLSQFAAGLRQLRHEAGSPPYRELAQRVHYSAGTLSDAAGGRKLPTLAVTLAYVRGCAGDTDLWERRWHEVAAEVSSTSRDDDSAEAPYVGLAPFRVEDAEWFFGRERMVEDLVARVRRRRLLAVFGPSGVGKSSLVRAGLLPAILSCQPGRKIPILFTPGEHPVEECAIQLAAHLTTAAGQLCDGLRADTRNLHRTVRQIVAEQSDDTELLIVVDQFEELFTLCADRTERAHFIDSLVTALTVDNSRARVVISVRADFYAHCADHPELREMLSDAQVLVGPMGASDLREAITRPAVKSECAVEGALVAELVAHASGQAGLLPMVSHVLRETWRRRRGNTLTLAGYHAAGGIQGALAKTAEDLYSSFDVEQQAVARDLFLRLTALGEGTEDTKRRIRRAELGADPRLDTVLAALADARLITVDTDTVEMAHESLIKAWPRLRGWLSQDREGLRIHRELTEAARAWDALNRDPSALYRGLRLESATTWAGTPGRGNADQLNAEEQDFLDASKAADAAERATARRRTRRLRQLVAVLAVVAVIAVAAFVYALRAQETAAGERNAAISQRLATQSDTIRNGNPALAAQLALAAYRLAPTFESRSSVLNSYVSASAPQAPDRKDAPNAVAYSQDGRLAVTAPDPDGFVLMDLTGRGGPQRLAQLIRSNDALYSAAFSPDGRFLAAANGERFHVWDLSTPSQPSPLPTATADIGRTYSLAFSPDGRVIATVGEDRAVRLWDTADPRQPISTVPNGHGGRIHEVAFAAGGRVMVTASADHTASLWDTGEPRSIRRLAVLPGHIDEVRSVAISSDGRLVATASWDRTARLWDIADPQRPYQLGVLFGESNRMVSIVMNPAGNAVATIDEGRTVRLWNVTTPRRPRMIGSIAGHGLTQSTISAEGHGLAKAGLFGLLYETSIVGADGPPVSVKLAGHTDAVYSVASDPSQPVVLTGSNDRTARLWNVKDPQKPELVSSFTGHASGIRTVALSSDHRTAATAGNDNVIRLWDTAGPQEQSTPVATLPGHFGAVNSIAISPDGRTIVSGSSDNTVVRWDISNPRQPRLLQPLAANEAAVINVVAFSRDGTIVAVGSAGRTVRLWDVEDPERPKRLAVLTDHVDRVLAVDFSPDGRTMATAGADHTVKLWDLADPARPRALSTFSDHAGPVYSIDFSTDGRTLATASGPDTVRLWDVTDLHRPQVSAKLTSNGGQVWSVAYSANGRTLVTGSDDQIAALRETDIERAVTQICAVAHPRITEDEWEQYLPGIDFTPPCH